jgi:hypothetical protein
MLYDPNQRVWIYEGVNPITDKTFYVGRTIDVLRRGAEHDRRSSACRQLREYLRLNNFKFSSCVRIVPELPNGVPASRAAEFEAFFIIQRDTVYHPERRADGCNLRHGDHVTALDYQAVKAEIADGFEWDEVPADVIKARAVEAMLEACVEEVGDVEPELADELTTAIIERKRIERLYMPVVALAETIAEEYEKMPMYKEVSRAEFVTDLNALRDRLNAEDVVDDKMLSLVRSIVLFGNPMGAEWEMRAHVAGHAFRMLAGALETREEAKMPDTLAIRNMKLVRDWTVENGGKKPGNNALARMGGTGGAEEQTRATFLTRWKAFKASNAYKQANKVECDFLMRHVSWWSDYVNGSRAEKGADLAAKVNAMLKQGYGHKHEPEFEGKKPWPSGSQGSETYRVYGKMKNMVFGHYADPSPMLDGVDDDRARWYMDTSAANRPGYLERMAKCQASARARSRRNGAQPKKRKLSEASSSTDALVEEDEEVEDDDKDDEDDEDEVGTAGSDSDEK